MYTIKQTSFTHKSTMPVQLMECHDILKACHFTSSSGKTFQESTENTPNGLDKDRHETCSGCGQKMLACDIHICRGCRERQNMGPSHAMVCTTCGTPRNAKCCNEIPLPCGVQYGTTCKYHYHRINQDSPDAGDRTQSFRVGVDIGTNRTEPMSHHLAVSQQITRGRGSMSLPTSSPFDAGIFDAVGSYRPGTDSHMNSVQQAFLRGKGNITQLAQKQQASGNNTATMRATLQHLVSSEPINDHTSPSDNSQCTIQKMNENMPLPHTSPAMDGLVTVSTKRAGDTAGGPSAVICNHVEMAAFRTDNSKEAAVAQATGKKQKDNNDVQVLITTKRNDDLFNLRRGVTRSLYALYGISVEFESTVGLTTRSNEHKAAFQSFRELEAKYPAWAMMRAMREVGDNSSLMMAIVKHIQNLEIYLHVDNFTIPKTSSGGATDASPDAVLLHLRTEATGFITQCTSVMKIALVNLSTICQEQGQDCIDILHMFIVANKQKIQAAMNTLTAMDRYVIGVKGFDPTQAPSSSLSILKPNPPASTLNINSDGRSIKATNNNTLNNHTINEINERRSAVLLPLLQRKHPSFMALDHAKYTNHLNETLRRNSPGTLQPNIQVTHKQVDSELQWSGGVQNRQLFMQFESKQDRDAQIKKLMEQQQRRLCMNQQPDQADHTPRLSDRTEIWPDVLFGHDSLFDIKDVLNKMNNIFVPSEEDTSSINTAKLPGCLNMDELKSCFSREHIFLFPLQTKNGTTVSQIAKLFFENDHASMDTNFACDECINLASYLIMGAVTMLIHNRGFPYQGHGDKAATAKFVYDNTYKYLSEACGDDRLKRNMKAWVSGSAVVNSMEYFEYMIQNNPWFSIVNSLLENLAECTSLYANNKQCKSIDGQAIVCAMVTCLAKTECMRENIISYYQYAAVECSNHWQNQQEAGNMPMRWNNDYFNHDPVRTDSKRWPSRTAADLAVMELRRKLEQQYPCMNYKQMYEEFSYVGKHGDKFPGTNLMEFTEKLFSAIVCSTNQWMYSCFKDKKELLVHPEMTGMPENTAYYGGIYHDTLRYALIAKCTNELNRIPMINMNSVNISYLPQNIADGTDDESGHEKIKKYLLSQDQFNRNNNMRTLLTFHGYCDGRSN